jgi:hypothetical protein
MNKRLLTPFLMVALVMILTIIVTAIEVNVFHNVPSFYVSICLIAVGSSLTTLWRAWKDDCLEQQRNAGLSSYARSQPTSKGGFLHRPGDLKRQMPEQPPEDDHQGSVHHYGDGLSFYTFSRLVGVPKYVKNVTIADSPNLIDVAAIHGGRAGKMGVFLMPRPNRHGDIMMRMKLAGVNMTQMFVHGFVTSRGVFVDRVEGAAIAKAAGQLLPGHESITYLTSEDLWEDEGGKET